MKIKRCVGCLEIKEIYAKRLCRKCYSKHIRYERKSKGVCIDCGRNRIAKNRSEWYCLICLSNKKTKQREYRLKKAKEELGIPK